MRKQPAKEIAGNRCVNLLSVSPVADDHIALEHILARPGWANYSDSRWTLSWSATLGSATAALSQDRVPIVICERDLDGNSWIDLLAEATALPEPPYVIVTSRLADEHLWAEALNLGAYDVLAKPFDPEEVIRVVSLAWLHWREQKMDAAPKVMRCVA